MTNKLKQERERFVQKLCKEKNWNPENLTSSQMLTIIQNKNYPKNEE